MRFDRLHLFEFEDQSWLPATLRNYMTDFLRVVFELFAPRSGVEVLLGRLLDADGGRRIVDLGSGGAGPILPLWQRLERDRGHPVEILLTDKYPNRQSGARLERASGGRILYHEGSVDATAVPSELTGVRTIFATFHHFPPETAARVLVDAAARGRPIGIFEPTERTVRMVLVTCLVPLLVWATTPFIRPFRLGRIVWTYLLPLVPLLALWDGLVSCLRTYSPRELEALVGTVPTDGWRWEAERMRVRGWPFSVTYLLGYPDRTGPCALAVDEPPALPAS